MAKVGRNDPCPCGSGSKYEKCCLPKAEQEKLEGISRQHTKESRQEKSPSRPVREEDFPFTLDDLEEDFLEDESFLEDEEFPEDDENKFETSAWWDEFEGADYEDRFGLFLQALEDPEALDDELTYEALNMIYEDTAERHERHRFDAMVTALQMRRPELYEESAPFYLDWGITNALISGNTEAMTTIAIALAERAEEDVEALSCTLDRMAYYGQHSLMLKTLHAAWPVLKGSSTVDPDTIDELKDLATNCVIFDYLERGREPDAQDPTLVNGLRYFSEVHHEHLAVYLQVLSGKIRSCWALEDFARDGARGKGRPGDDLFKSQVFHLCTEFLRYLRLERDVPYTKGHIARVQLFFYYLLRDEGVLETGQMGLEAAAKRPQKKSKKKSRPQLEHPLCPNASTFEVFLGGLLESFEPHDLKAATTFELLPAWLDFLNSVGLLETEQKARALTAIYPLREHVIEALSVSFEDPAIEENIEKAWGAVNV